MGETLTALKSGSRSHHSLFAGSDFEVEISGRNNTCDSWKYRMQSDLQQLACKKGGKKSRYGGEDSEVVQLINTFCTEIQQLVLTIFMIAHFYHGLWAFGISGFWTERPCPIQFGSADCDHA